MDNDQATIQLTRRFSYLPARLQIISLAVALILLGATALTLLVVLKTLVFRLDLLSGFWSQVVAGPFAGIWVFPEQALPALAFINLAALFAHPIWPNRFTAAITLLATAIWMFFGMAIACSPV